MMHFMHIGGDEDITKRLVQSLGQIDIGMRKGCSQYHQCLVDHHRIHGGAGDEDEEHKEDPPQ